MRRKRFLESEPTEAQRALERVEDLLARQPLTSLERHWLEEDLQPLREAAKVENPAGLLEELDDARWALEQARDALDW
jgi:hypothetical protein